jgi:lipopolysaccharide biosynthesis glycosyltransferase
MNMTLAHSGVIYSVTGEKFLREAERSAASVRRHMPGLRIAIYTERTDADPSLFDIIRPIAAPTFSVFDKQFGFRETLFEKSLFLDSDTYVVKAFPEIFDLLDRFDFAATREFWSGNQTHRSRLLR